MSAKGGDTELTTTTALANVPAEARQFVQDAPLLENAPNRTSHAAAIVPERKKTPRASLPKSLSMPSNSAILK